MGNLLFSPSGRINSGEFLKAALILIAVGFVLNLPSLLGMKAIATPLGLLSYLLAYPWIVIWVKRYHDSGKSGWMCLIPLLVYIVIFLVAMFMALGNEIGQIFELAASGASQAEQEAAAEGMIEGKEMLVGMIGIVASLVVVLLFNALIKHDDHENQFGPES